MWQNRLKLRKINHPKGVTIFNIFMQAISIQKTTRRCFIKRFQWQNTFTWIYGQIIDSKRRWNWMVFLWAIRIIQYSSIYCGTIGALNGGSDYTIAHENLYSSFISADSNHDYPYGHVGHSIYLHVCPCWWCAMHADISISTQQPQTYLQSQNWRNFCQIFFFLKIDFARWTFIRQQIQLNSRIASLVWMSEIKSSQHISTHCSLFKTPI